MRLSKRQVLGAMAGLGLPVSFARAQGTSSGEATSGHKMLGTNRVVGTVDYASNGFDPMELATKFDFGTTSIAADGRRLREWTITAIDKELEIAPGVFFPAWTYNGRVPGPTLRCREGDRPNGS